MTSVYAKNKDNKVLLQITVYLDTFLKSNSDLKVFYKSGNENKKFVWAETDLFSFLAKEMLNASDERRLMLSEDEIKIIKKGQEIVASWKNSNTTNLEYYYFVPYQDWVDSEEEMSMAIAPIYDTNVLASLAPIILKTNSQIKDVQNAINTITSGLRSNRNKKFALPMDISKIEFVRPDYALIRKEHDGLSGPFIEFLKSKNPPSYNSSSKSLTVLEPVKARDIAAFIQTPFTQKEINKDTIAYTSYYAKTHENDFLQSITYAPPSSTDMLNVDNQLVQPQKAYFIFVPHYQNSNLLVENHNVFLVSSAYVNSPTTPDEKTDNSLLNLSKISNSQLFESIEEAHKYAQYYGHAKDYIICEIDFSFNRLITQSDLINSASTIQDKIAALVEKEKIQTHLQTPKNVLTLEEKVKYYERVLSLNNLGSSILTNPQIEVSPNSAIKAKNKL